MKNDVENLMHQINRSWLEGRPQDIREVLHPDVVMVFPRFVGRSKGADFMMAEFEDFDTNASVLEYDASNPEIDIVDGVAVVSYLFSIAYERGGRRYRSRGRDLWIFAEVQGEWKAAWRTMLDLHDEEM